MMCAMQMALPRVNNEPHYDDQFSQYYTSASTDTSCTTAGSYTAKSHVSLLVRAQIPAYLTRVYVSKSAWDPGDRPVERWQGELPGKPYFSLREQCLFGCHLLQMGFSFITPSGPGSRGHLQDSLPIVHCRYPRYV